MFTKRIMGLETEYGVTCVVDGQRRLSPDEVARYLFRKVVVWGRSSNVFLPNGGRLYLDVGSHPEYATAECDNLSDLIKQDQAGDRIVEELAVEAEIRLNAEEQNELIEKIILNKMEKYREKANRDRFVLPIGEDIKIFTDIIDKSIDFFN